MKIEYSSFCESGSNAHCDDYVKVTEIGDKYTLFVLCDGMQWHNFGGFASRTVAISVSDYWKSACEDDDCIGKVNAACKNAADVLDHKSDMMGHISMGATMVMLIADIEDNKLFVAHVGDSRCYILRKGYFDFRNCLLSGNLEYLTSNVLYQTQDHVNVQFGNTVLSRCFFSYQKEISVPEIQCFELKPGDIIFLCSNGVSGSIPSSMLKEMLLKNQSPEQICQVIKSRCEKETSESYAGVFISVT